MHINRTNGKVYVGMTTKTPKERWRNGKGYKTLRFGRAIQKYGWDGFEHVIIADGLTREEACLLEKILIAEKDATNPQFGYNEAIGGESGGMYKKHHTEESKEKIRKARIKDGFTDEHKKHISESKQGAKHHMAKPVYQYSKGGEFIRKWDYMNEAAKELHLSRGNISNVCLGRVKTCGGFIWTYEYKGIHL